MEKIMSGKVRKGTVCYEETINEFGFLDGCDESEFIGNVIWSLKADATKCTKPEETKYLSITLICEQDNRGNLWSCNASVCFSVKKNNSEDPKDVFSKEYKKRFDSRSRSLVVSDFMDWEEFRSKYTVNNYAFIEASIEMSDLVGIQEVIIEDFSEPNGNLTDVVLVVEGKKVHVGKQILARSSKFFHALFYSDFSENAQSEVTIEDVVHSEFVDFLNIVYQTHETIDFFNVKHILKLADRFGSDFVVGKCEDCLCKDSTIHVVDKFLLAEKYNLSALQNTCLETVNSMNNFYEISDHENYKQLGDITYSAILQKLASLKRKRSY